MAEQRGYDTIGISYGRFRRSDPRIARRIYRALGGAVSVVNVGAGHGSYEPTDRDVIAVEPSLTMIRQRPQNAAPVVQAVAESLPFADATFGAAMALLTVHHWHDAHRGLAELQRVTYGPIVVFAFDPAVRDDQWLVTEYLPRLADLHAHYPTSHEIAEALGDARVEVVPIPHDCVDGFGDALWRRPAAYLDPDVRSGISDIARLPADDVSEAMARLRQDLDSGKWRERHVDLLNRDEHDGGFRLVVAAPRP